MGDLSAFSSQSGVCICAAPGTCWDLVSVSSFETMRAGYHQGRNKIAFPTSDHR